MLTANLPAKITCDRSMQQTPQQRPHGQLAGQVTQQELADAVGSVREVVARVLRDFRLARLVATGPDRVHILDPAALHAQVWHPTAS
jgi:CRP/FNR family transcriptional regulator, cyclic AMP receptor protein